MMNFIHEHTTAVLGGVLTVVLIGGYLFFFGGPSPSSSTLQVTIPSTAAQGGVSQELLATLLQLHSITLDDRLWSDPSFQSLRDFGVDLAPEPIGRENPFAPLGSPARAAQSASTGTAKGAK